MTRADVLAVDLPWGRARHRTAIASRSPAGIAVVTVADDDALVAYVRAHAAPRALVVLDVPLDGLAPWRPIETRFVRLGIPVLPPGAAGTRGPDLRARLARRCVEVYPYAVLRALWALELAGARFAFDAPDVDLAPHWRAWPPKYKRERDLAARRRNVVRVGAVLAAIPGFAPAVRTLRGATHRELDRLCDEYDALLGLVAGIALRDRSPWAWHAKAEQAAVLAIADASLRRRFRARR